MTIINFINKYLLVYLNKYSIQTCKNSIDIIIYLSILIAFIFMIVLFIKCGKNEKIENKKDIFIIFVISMGLFITVSVAFSTYIMLIWFLLTPIVNILYFLLKYHYNKILYFLLLLIIFTIIIIFQYIIQKVKERSKKMEMNLKWKENNLGLSGYANYRFIDIERKFDINKSSTLYYTITHIELPGISPSDYITKKFKTIEEVKTFAINIVRNWEMLIGISKINSLDELNFCVPENTIEPNCLKIIMCGSFSIATLTKIWSWSRKWKSNFENWEPVCFSRYKISHRNSEKCINEVIEKFIEFLFVNFYQIKE